MPDGADRSPAAAGEPLLVVDHASKSFGAVRALEDGFIELHAGEAHALVGENGAGKSTLVKILAGVHRPDTGRVLIKGAEVVFDTTAQSHAAGIAIIFQEPTLFPDLTVAENVFIGAQPLRSGRRIDRRQMRRAVEGLFEELGVKLDPDRIARGLSIADQQIVEIAKALSAKARVIVMDEPTAALTQTEVDRLFRVVETLRAQGAAVLFISHRLDEVFTLCQRVTVMRDGSHVATEAVADTTTQRLIHAMVGRDLDTLYPKEVAEIGETVLKVDRLTREGVFTDISFEVRAGEIVALAGLVGAGRSEVARAIFGIDRADAGAVQVHGRKLPPASPNAAMAAGIGFVPEDRRQQGLVMPLSLERNMALASLGRLRRYLLIPRHSEHAFASHWATRLQLRYDKLGDPASKLSGGNQQKVVLAKWLAREPSLLIIDEPTRGIDVGTKAEVHRLLSDLAGQGVAILMISSELPEVLGMADRVIVLFEGRISGEFTRAEASELVVMRAAAGLSGEEAA